MSNSSYHIPLKNPLTSQREIPPKKNNGQKFQPQWKLLLKLNGTRNRLEDEQLFSAFGLLDRYAASANAPIAAGPGAFALVLAVTWSKKRFNEIKLTMKWYQFALMCKFLKSSHVNCCILFNFLRKMEWGKDAAED